MYRIKINNKEVATGSFLHVVQRLPYGAKLVGSSVRKKEGIIFENSFVFIAEAPNKRIEVIVITNSKDEERGY